MTYKRDALQRRKRLRGLHSYGRIGEYGNACPLCHRQELSDGDFQIHHVMPVVGNGTSPPWNLIRICRTCHAVLEFGNAEDAIEMRVRAHVAQVARYGLLYALYFARISKNEDGRRGIRAVLGMITRREADTALRGSAAHVAPLERLR